MAIEKVRRTWFLVERNELDAFVRALAASKTTHVVDLREQETGLTSSVSAPAERQRAVHARDRIQKLSRALDILDELAPRKRALHENFVNLPMEMTRAEFDGAVAEIDADQIHDRAAAIRRAHSEAAKRADELSRRIVELSPWADVQAPPAGLRRCGAALGTVPARLWPRLEAAARSVAELSVERVAVAGAMVLVAAAWTKASEREAGELLAAHVFAPLDVEAGAGRIGGIVDAARAELAEAENKADVAEAEAAALAEDRRKLVAALAHWEAELERSETSGKAVASKRIAILSGYVRVREMGKLEAFLRREFPAVGLVAEDPKLGEDVPVSLGGSKFFAPAQFLTSMFGLPNYFDFDPSPYIFFTFLLFFGLCFGDVVYGLVLGGLGWWLARKSGGNRSLARFFGLLMWGGMAAVIVGVVTGSWASDLLTEQYVGAGSPLSRIRRGLMLFDPMGNPMAALGIALGLGILNQFYGILLRMYREFRRGRYIAGICDSGLWLVFLPCLVLLLAGVARVVPPAATRTAGILLLASAVGLMLTQGRNEKTLLMKAVTGVVSIYGILGTYGTTSFIGDTLSYSRLLALGMTTAVVGTVANKLAGLASAAPFVGVLLFVLIAAPGHALNILLSILSAFVHSARLIFVEFFGRFYEGGARPFVPLGATRSVRVIDQG